jgi:hypothetical protein
MYKCLVPQIPYILRAKRKGHHSFQCLREDPKISHIERFERIMLRNSEFYCENLIKTPE